MGPMCDMCHHLIGSKSKVMDKRIRKSKGANRRVTCCKMRPPHLTLDQTIRWEERKQRKRKDREDEGRKRSSTFSLVFPAIGPSVPVGVRKKVLPRDKS